jgi:hypothetical protein
MEILIKTIKSDKECKWLGIFGDCVKLRIHTNDESIPTALRSFIASDFGVTNELIIVNPHSKKDFYKVSFPDEAYEILMSCMPGSK